MYFVNPLDTPSYEPVFYLLLHLKRGGWRFTSIWGIIRFLRNCQPFEKYMSSDRALNFIGTFSGQVFLLSLSSLPSSFSSSASTINSFIIVPFGGCWPGRVVAGLCNSKGIGKTFIPAMRLLACRPAGALSLSPSIVSQMGRFSLQQQQQQRRLYIIFIVMTINIPLDNTQNTAC